MAWIDMADNWFNTPSVDAEAILTEILEGLNVVTRLWQPAPPENRLLPMPLRYI